MSARGGYYHLYITITTVYTLQRRTERYSFSQQDASPKTHLHLLQLATLYPTPTFLPAPPTPAPSAHPPPNPTHPHRRPPPQLRPPHDPPLRPRAPLHHRLLAHLGPQSPHIRRHHHRLHPRHLQLSEIVFVGRSGYVVRVTDQRSGKEGTGG